MKLIDLTKQRFGKLTVLERDGSDQYGHALWRCQCDCGGDIDVRGVDLRTGNTVGCGCQQYKLIDEIGKRYGRLAVIERGPDDKSYGTTRTMWLCRCDCGNETLVPGGSLRAGSIKSCGCQHPLPEGKAAFNALMSNLRGRARKLGLDFSLTDYQVRQLIHSCCFYCGVQPYQVKKIRGNGNLIYNGLDRINNHLGYTPDNVVPCCGRCNRMKRALSQKDFRKHVRQIHDHWASKE